MSIKTILRTANNLYTKNDIRPCTNYLSSLIFPMENGQHYVKTDAGFKVYDTTTISQVIFARLPKKIKEWYFREYDSTFDLVMDPKGPRIMNDAINVFEGFKYTDIPFNHSENDISGMNMMLDFINEVICSNNNDLFDYVLKFLANIAKGNKNRSCLYLKGPQGIGKSTFTEFLINIVFGNKVCMNCNADPLLGNYNSQLMGKILVVFEELPTFTTAQWNGVSATLKNMITSDKQHYNEKYVKSVYVTNLNNYIINTNTDSIKDSNGRRYCILDLSTKYQGKHKFFNKLYSNCFNDNVGKCFYDYLLTIDVSNFDSQGDMPLTRNKIDVFSESLPLEYKFLKHTYIFKNTSVNKTVDELYKEYMSFCCEMDKKPKGKIKFTKKLREINIDYKSTNGSNKYRISHATLLNMAQEKHWIHELDGYQVKKLTKQERLDEIVLQVAELKDEYKKLLRLKENTIFRTIEKKDSYFELEN